jgi:uncharacterized protein (TIGR02596 family)
VRRRAFSLIELLMVISIIAIIVALTVPAFNQIGRAQALAKGTSAVIDLLAFARQTALAQNRVVEVRFYRRRENPAQAEDPVANPSRFRACRAVIYDEKVLTYRPLTALENLPVRIIVMDDRKFSTAIFPYKDTVPARPLQEEMLFGEKEPTKFQCIRFKPNGATDLNPMGTPDQDKWSLTIKSDNDPVMAEKPAHNYATAMLEPVSGRVRIFRP